MLEKRGLWMVHWRFGTKGGLFDLVAFRPRRSHVTLNASGYATFVARSGRRGVTS